MRLQTHSNKSQVSVNTAVSYQSQGVFNQWRKPDFHFRNARQRYDCYSGCLRVTHERLGYHSLTDRSMSDVAPREEVVRAQQEVQENRGTTHVDTLLSLYYRAPLSLQLASRGKNKNVLMMKDVIGPRGAIQHCTMVARLGLSITMDTGIRHLGFART